jgi:RNA polymerase sigma-70 factor (ECF subfamily)
VSPPGLEDDRSWLDGYRRGDRAAFARVLDRYLDDVARTVRAGVVVAVDGQRTRVGRGLPEHEVEALIHDTFVRAFAETARTGYDGVRPFGAYLATIARNLVVDHGRRTQHDRAAAAVVIDPDTLVDDEIPRADDALAGRELAAVVAQFVRELDELDRRVFALRYEEEASHRAIGAELGLTEIQVRRREARLRAALLAALRAHGQLSGREVAIGSSLLPRRAREET